MQKEEKPFKKDNAYLDRLFTTGVVNYPGVKHIANRPAGRAKDFAAAVELAKKCAPPQEIESGKIMGGFAHNQILALACKVIALKLKEAFGLNDINELPVSYDIAWYEQKAVAVLLALLFLGVKGIRLCPTLPGFLSPNAANVLVERFNIKPIGTVEADIAAVMAGN